jgi:hypothetical protein
MPAKLNLIGQKFGDWIVIAEARAGSELKWSCRCKCGGEHLVSTGNLRSGASKRCRKCGHDLGAERRHANLLGKRFGKLKAIEKTRERSDNKVVWRCLCDCGNESFVASSSLISGNTGSCGCAWEERLPRRLDISGERFGRLVAVKFVRMDKTRSVWKFKCDCGNYVTRLATYVKGKSGYQLASCGKCFRPRSHGLSRHPWYQRFLANNRRAKEAGADGCYSIDEWESVVSAHDNSCVACGKGVRFIGSRGRAVSLDHIVPLSVGGSNWPTNLQPMCLSCNASRRAMDFWPWMHKKHPDRCTHEYIAEWHRIRKRIEKWFSQRQQQAA